jgi:hypothetical protein
VNFPEKTQGPEPRDEHPAEAYEPPSLTELGSFADLTAGGNQTGTDIDSVSVVN